MAAGPPEDLLDPVTLLATCGGDPLLLRKMIDSFRSRAPEYLAELHDAAQRQDRTRLRRTAHQLRGLASTFSTSVAAAVEVLEQLAQDHQADRAPEQCATVADLIGALSEALSTVSVEHLKRLSVPA